MNLELNCAPLIADEELNIKIPPEDAEKYPENIDPESLQKYIENGGATIEIQVEEEKNTEKESKVEESPSK